MMRCRYFEIPGLELETYQSLELFYSRRILLTEYFPNKIYSYLEDGILMFRVIL